MNDLDDIRTPREMLRGESIETVRARLEARKAKRAAAKERRAARKAHRARAR